jgi:hypothetical protein
MASVAGQDSEAVLTDVSSQMGSYHREIQTRHNAKDATTLPAIVALG